MDINDEWARFLSGTAQPNARTVSPKGEWFFSEEEEGCHHPNGEDEDAPCYGDVERDPEGNGQTPAAVAPPCGDLHISTKTKVLFLNCEIDTHQMFWDLPVVEYWLPVEGIIKKQLKIISNTPEEFSSMQERLEQSPHFRTEMVFKHVDNPSAKRLKFRDDRKLTVGMSKKDIMNCRGKPKKAFMNCFAIIMRFLFGGEFKEVHIKVFNTGKMEIPGVPDDGMLETVKAKLLDNLRPYVRLRDGVQELGYICEWNEHDEEDNDVLINSDFRCGYSINQKACYSILRSDKYGIETSYDSCHYPGIRCKYYYRNDLPADHLEQNGRIDASDVGIKLSALELCKKYTAVSFMIFSTGSCLIVGNCPKRVLLHVYAFMKRFLADEYARIAVTDGHSPSKPKKMKQRKRMVSMQLNYLHSIVPYPVYGKRSREAGGMLFYDGPLPSQQPLLPVRAATEEVEADEEEEDGKDDINSVEMDSAERGLY
jgi:hypothetical protein